MSTNLFCKIDEFLIKTKQKRQQASMRILQVWVTPEPKIVLPISRDRERRIWSCFIHPGFGSLTSGCLQLSRSTSKEFMLPACRPWNVQRFLFCCVIVSHSFPFQDTSINETRLVVTTVNITEIEASFSLPIFAVTGTLNDSVFFSTIFLLCTPLKHNYAITLTLYGTLFLILATTGTLF
jgi:hypothetical protein